MTSYRIVSLLFALISLALAFDLAAIKPRFPQQFMATITIQDNNNQHYYYNGYPCLFDSINKQEKCGGYGNYRIRNFSNNTFTETNYTTDFPFKCNISTNNINGAQLLDPNWFDKLNLSLVDLQGGSYQWKFFLKKPTLLEELPFTPKFIGQHNHEEQIPFNKFRNIIGTVSTSDSDHSWPKSISLSFDIAGYQCPHNYQCRRSYSWRFDRYSLFGTNSPVVATQPEMFQHLFTLPSYLPPCQNVNVQSAEQEEDDD